MNTSAYLERIGYRGPLRPGIDVLRRLQRKHLLSVPFENLDIHLGRPIKLDQKSFYNKIVGKRRGGYCYELNGCFARLLSNMGFNVRMLSARVATKDGGFSPDFEHMTLLVRLKGKRWLADVGFGDSFTEPKQIDNSTPQKDDGQLYQISRKDGKRVLSRWNDPLSSWEPQYAFSLRPRSLVEFAARNRYQQTSPRSHFTQGRLISRLTPTGRVTLTDTRLIMTNGKKRIEHRLRNRREFDRLLAKHFGLRLG